MSAPVVVAVVSAGAREHLARCLASLHADHTAGRAEVWVVDNASTDGSPELVRERFGWVHLIASQENLGYGRAVNLVASRTDSPWLVAANDDTAVEPGALAALIAAARPNSGMVVPRLVLPDGSPQHSVNPFPSPLVAALEDSGLWRAVPRLAERMCLPRAWDPDRARDVPWALAAFSLLRREAFDAAGGFDADRWMYAEDLDLGWQLGRAGWATRYAPEARVHHHGGASTEQAFGAERTARRMEATYGWLALRRGRAVARATAAIAVGLHGGRAALWTLAPGRFAPRRDRARFWRDAHRVGLGPLPDR